MDNNFSIKKAFIKNGKLKTISRNFKCDSLDKI